MWSTGRTSGPCISSRPVLRSQRLRCVHATAPLTSAPPQQKGPQEAPPSTRLADVGQLSHSERAALAEQFGFRSIGKDLPEGTKLTDIVRSLPKSVFDIDTSKAWRGVVTSLLSLPAALALVYFSPPWLLPLSWFIAGTAFTGWFVVGHDCGHRSFHPNRLVEDIVGNVMFAPLLYPFEPWRIKHNQHHAFTNKLEDDTAWHPVMPEEAEELRKGGALGKLVLGFLGSPLKLWASIFHWAIWHFDTRKFTRKQMPRVLISWVSCAVFAATAFPALFAYGGVWAIVKFWLMPWLGYHFWMSTFTIVHHTAPHIPFKRGGEWDAARAQLSGTVHCDFPRWVEFLCHDISWHVPHHVASTIPWYNLRAATVSLRERWGEYMTEAKFNPRLVKTIVTQCHVYDEDANYLPFDAKKPERFFEVQRKFLPDLM